MQHPQRHRTPQASTAPHASSEHDRARERLMRTASQNATPSDQHSAPWRLRASRLVARIRGAGAALLARADYCAAARGSTRESSVGYSLQQAQRLLPVPALLACTAAAALAPPSRLHHHPLLPAKSFRPVPALLACPDNRATHLPQQEKAPLPALPHPPPAGVLRYPSPLCAASSVGALPGVPLVAVAALASAGFSAVLRRARPPSPQAKSFLPCTALLLAALRLIAHSGRCPWDTLCSKRSAFPQCLPFSHVLMTARWLTASSQC